MVHVVGVAAPGAWAWLDHYARIQARLRPRPQPRFYTIVVFVTTPLSSLRTNNAHCVAVSLHAADLYELARRVRHYRINKKKYARSRLRAHRRINCENTIIKLNANLLLRLDGSINRRDDTRQNCTFPAVAVALVQHPWTVMEAGESRDGSGRRAAADCDRWPQHAVPLPRQSFSNQPGLSIE